MSPPRVPVVLGLGPGVGAAIVAAAPHAHNGDPGPCHSPDGIRRARPAPPAAGRTAADRSPGDRAGPGPLTASGTASPVGGTVRGRPTRLAPAGGVPQLVPAVDAALVPSGRGGRRPAGGNDGQSSAAELPSSGSGRLARVLPAPGSHGPMTALEPGSTRAACIPDGSRQASGRGSSSRATVGRVVDEPDDDAIEAEALAADVHAPRMPALRMQAAVVQAAVVQAAGLPAASVPVAGRHAPGTHAAGVHVRGTHAAGTRRTGAPIAGPRRPAGSRPGSVTAMAR